MSAAAAEELVKKAEQKMKGGGGLWGYLSGGPKYDEAIEIYQQAANQYKMAKMWQEAGNCFVQCAFCAEKSGSQSDQANYLSEAGNVLKKVSTQLAVEQLEQAVSIYSAGGRFQQAGKLLLSVAELYEAERLQHKECKAFYKRAAEMFELADHSESNFSKCNLKYAEFAAKDGELEEAIRIFESEGEKALGKTLLQFGAKEHFLNAGILHLVGPVDLLPLAATTTAAATACKSYCWSPVVSMQYAHHRHHGHYHDPHHHDRHHNRNTRERLYWRLKTSPRRQRH
ncbi:alphaSnap [Symbiodinium sp. CCMP2592]|nr:alphaSnap [Symbiodinium sp. CCMP2592]